MSICLRPLLIGHPHRSKYFDAALKHITSLQEDWLAKGGEILTSSKPSQAKPSQAKPSQAKPSQAKPSQAKPSQAKPSQAKPSQAKPSQAKQGESGARPSGPHQCAPGKAPIFLSRRNAVSGSPGTVMASSSTDAVASGSLRPLSHIKPWSVSSNRERLDPANGLLLLANVDALFDAELVTFENDGRMLVSKLVPAGEKKRLGLPRRLARAPDRHERAYLAQHRKMKFQR